jgi:hypothetical protein
VIADLNLAQHINDQKSVYTTGMAQGYRVFICVEKTFKRKLRLDYRQFSSDSGNYICRLYYFVFILVCKYAVKTTVITKKIVALRKTFSFDI